MNKLEFASSSLAMVIFSLSHMLDTGEHDAITLEQVKRHARAGSLIAFLKECNGGSFAQGLFDVRIEFGRWWEEQIAENCDAMDGSERRKYGIEKRGLCLLISYTAEIIQHGDLKFDQAVA